MAWACHGREAGGGRVAGGGVHVGDVEFFQKIFLLYCLMGLTSGPLSISAHIEFLCQLMRHGVDVISPSSWEPQEEGMMSTIANFPSERNQGLLNPGKNQTPEVMLASFTIALDNL
jgi:hypothetical protein